MNLAVWKKAISDAWPQLVITSALLLLFGWLFIWITSLFKLGLWASFLNMLPAFVQQMMGVPIAEMATVTGRISILYLHVVTLILMLGWSVGRGSDVVSGGIASGHLELMLTLPIRRVSILFAHAVVVTIGAAVLAAALWLGNWVGLLTVEMEGPTSIWRFLPGAVNLFAMTFFLAGVTALLSSCDRNRWRTIWLACGFFVVSEIIEMVGRMWERGAWLQYLSFLTAFQPHKLILTREDVWTASMWHNGPLIALGLVAYVAAAIIFSCRDIPVPR